MMATELVVSIQLQQYKSFHLFVKHFNSTKLTVFNRNVTHFNTGTTLIDKYYIPITLDWLHRSFHKTSFNHSHKNSYNPLHFKGSNHSTVDPNSGYVNASTSNIIFQTNKIRNRSLIFNYQYLRRDYKILH